MKFTVTKILALVILLKVAFCALFAWLAYTICGWCGLEENTSLIIAVITGIVGMLR